MEPFGDPEARIRDLERPLADQASASEMGTRPTAAAANPHLSSGVPVPPPYGPPPDPYQGQAFGSYGSPYYAPPQQMVHKRSQSAVWLVPLVIGVLAVAIAVGAVVFFSVRDTATQLTKPGSPTVSGGGGPVDGPTVPSLPEIPVPEFPALPVIPGLGPTDEVLTVESGNSLSIGGVERQQTIICNDGTVSISGMNNTIEVQGSCGSVTVSGMENTITVESARTISASGFDNRVTYRSGDPQISQSGSGNVIERG